jgi:hypothetical protein
MNETKMDTWVLKTFQTFKTFIIGWIKNELVFKIPKQVVKLFEVEK